MRNFLILAMLVGLISCSQEEEVRRHDQLMAFKSTFLAENGEDEYFELEKDIGTTEIEYLNDIMCVTLIEEANTCANYEGDISIQNNVVSLRYFNINEDGEVCTSQSIYRFTYIIDNPELEEYSIIQE